MVTQAEETERIDLDSNPFFGGKPEVCPVYGTAHRYTVVTNWKSDAGYGDDGQQIIYWATKLSCPCLTASKEI